MQDIVITVENLSKSYLVAHLSRGRESYALLRDVIAREARNFARKAADLVRGRQIVQGDEVEEFWALRDVNFDIRRGEVVGIVGRNGAGKSTLLKILSRITEPTGGRVTIRGRVASLLEVGTGFHPELSGRENIYLNGAILGLTRKEIRSKFEQIVAFAEVEQFLDTPVKRYSSGMYVRLAFAIAAHLEYEILIVDEVLAVGDAEFQRKCLGKMQEISGRSGRTVLFVSHNMAAVKELCSRAILIDCGRIKQLGTPADVVANYLSSVGTAPQVDLRAMKQFGPQTFSRLLELYLCNDAGTPTTTFFMDEPFVARILVEITRPERRLEIGLKISSRYGAAIHYLTSPWEGFSPDLQEGHHWFEVRVPSLLLFPGIYHIGAWICKQPDRSSDVNVQEATSIQVLKSDVTGYPTYMEDYVVSGGEVYVPSEWKLLGSTGHRELFTCRAESFWRQEAVRD